MSLVEQQPNLNLTLRPRSRHWYFSKNPMPKPTAQKRSFLSQTPASPEIKLLIRTKTLGKTFAVLAGFCHAKA